MEDWWLGENHLARYAGKEFGYLWSKTTERIEAGGCMSAGINRPGLPVLLRTRRGGIHLGREGHRYTDLRRRPTKRTALPGQPDIGQRLNGAQIELEEATAAFVRIFRGLTASS
jgi:hypothetical protein